MKFGIITYILHKKQKGKLYSYSPYISEMNIWFRFASKSLVAAPKISGNPSAIEIPYSEDIEFYKIPALNFTNFRNRIISFLKIPKVVWGILRVMREADHIHLRCPGNISLIGCFLQIFFPKKPKTVKYAGNWDPDAAQPWSYKLQKKILRNTFLSRNIKVLVYGEWPNQTNNILPFFTASFSETEKALPKKDFTAPFKFLFVGSLVEGKSPLYAIKLLEALMAKAIPVSLELYGDGVLRKELESYVKNKNLDPFVNFLGNRNPVEVKEAYQRSHFVVLASKSEGWPKALAEGMFFGCIPIATPVSCVPWMLNYGSRGILISDVEEREENREKRSFSETAIERIVKLLNKRENLDEMSRAAQEWSQQYTLERFEGEIKKLLVLKED